MEENLNEIFLRRCVENDLDGVQSCLSQGTDVNTMNQRGLSGLNCAVFTRQTELLDILLSHPDIEVNKTTTRQGELRRSWVNWTPLMFACLKGHDNIVRRLSQVPGIQYNCRNESGHTALHLAVLSNRAGCVEVLRGAGVSVDWNLRDNFGRTPLTMAVHRGYPDILQTILSVPDPQLDLSVTDIIGRDVARIAVMNNKVDVLRCVELLSQDRRVNWNIKNSDGDTSLMFCLKYNMTEKALTVLNNANIDLGIKDRLGRYHEDIAR